MLVFDLDKFAKLFYKRGMSVRDAAKAAGISEGALYKVLDGSRPDPKASTLLSLAMALGHHPMDYMTGRE